ncbi:3-oxoacyl-ACP synthase III family protein [Micromonospora lutea]|uniref:3-oxoacyl-[acyl-carrier-protein] synthase 3 protein 2 n=1 Tax=Micromonospora lutea TaxID=419825 RepID=A0ABQ4IPC7_9ACTN|nr:3-oxoacyl-[acyl-carrier-protein] synthase III C-terminal domain-containing protein [Micromonospora lutea]GIJ19753.1 3-oxoacyl-[acyl-carrier-protein] synthase 3 protein 2 [Micromonospora lutea]
MAAGLTDIEAWVPPNRISNEHFSGISLTDAWITRRTGIHSRAWFADEADLTAAAADVVRTVVDRGPDPERIGALLLVSTSNDARVPGLAQAVATRAGLRPSVLSVDLNAACCGTVYALTMALGLVTAGTVAEALVCSVEAMSRITDKSDRQTAFLFGDGVGVLRVADREQFAPPRSVAGCDAAFADLMTMGPNGVQIRGIEVYERAVARMVRVLADVSADYKPDVVVAHQANGRILQEVRRRLPDPAPVFVNRIAELGNTSSASIPLALAAELTDGAVARRARLAAVAYGAGEAYGAVSIDYDIDHELPVGPQPFVKGEA